MRQYRYQMPGPVIITDILCALCVGQMKPPVPTARHPCFTGSGPRIFALARVQSYPGNIGNKPLPDFTGPVGIIRYLPTSIFGLIKSSYYGPHDNIFNMTWYLEQSFPMYRTSSLCNNHQSWDVQNYTHFKHCGSS